MRVSQRGALVVGDDLDGDALSRRSLSVVGIAFEVANVMRQRKHTDVNSAARFCSELILRGVASLPVTVGDRY